MKLDYGIDGISFIPEGENDKKILEQLLNSFSIKADDDGIKNVPDATYGHRTHSVFFSKSGELVIVEI